MAGRGLLKLKVGIDPAAGSVNQAQLVNESMKSMKGGRHEGTRLSRPGREGWEDVADPELEDDTDAIVRVDSATICGTDLHILKGDVPEVDTGRILGHEAVGTVEAAGRRQEPQAGDRVLVSCISACGTCRFCRQGRTGSAAVAVAGSSAT